MLTRDAPRPRQLCYRPQGVCGPVMPGQHDYRSTAIVSKGHPRRQSGTQYVAWTVFQCWQALPACTSSGPHTRQCCPRAQTPACPLSTAFAVGDPPRSPRYMCSAGMHKRGLVPASLSVRQAYNFQIAHPHMSGLSRSHPCSDLRSHQMHRSRATIHYHHPSQLDTVRLALAVPEQMLSVTFTPLLTVDQAAALPGCTGRIL